MDEKDLSVETRDDPSDEVFELDPHDPILNFAALHPRAFVVGELLKSVFSSEIYLKGATSNEKWTQGRH